MPPRFVPNSALLVGLGCDVDADGWVTVDNTGRTSVPGVWAAGNVVDPRAQVITAAGAGSAAAIALNADLVEDDVRNAVRDLDHGFLPRTHHQRPPEGVTMTTAAPDPTRPECPARAAGPPTKHQLALMIWLAVFPTLTVLNLALGDWLRTLTPVAAHLRARDHRGADRHLRPDAAAAPAPRTPADPHREQLSHHTLRTHGVLPGGPATQHGAARGNDPGSLTPAATLTRPSTTERHVHNHQEGSSP